MKVVLRNNAIFVLGNPQTLEEPWVEEFFEHHLHNTLFLDNGVLVLNNEGSLAQKEEFLETLSDEYTKANDLSSPFYRRSLKRCKSAAVRIELPYRQEEKIDIDLYAFGPNRVKFTFSSPSTWVMRYLKQQLSSLVLNATSTNIYIDVSTPQAKARLERTLNRREVLHYSINYRYDDEFMSRLYGQYRGWGFNNDTIDKMIRYHAIFEIPLGTKATDLKKRYRELAKRYHPDRVQGKTPEIINQYTQKFQLLQEAYDALRSAS